MHLSAIDVLQGIGVQLATDVDGRLEFDVPESYDAEALRRMLFDNGEQLARELRLRAARDRGVLMGGPFDGQRNWLGLPGEMVVRKVERARWAVYRVLDFDGRAAFQGYSSSYRKGRRGQLSGSRR